MREQTKTKVGCVLDYVNEHIEQNGFPPSVREICAALGYKSTSTVHIYLKALEEEGKIKKSPSKPRTLRVMPNVDEKSGVRQNDNHRQAVIPSGASRMTQRPQPMAASLASASARLRAAPANEDTVYVPVIGRVTAGRPILAEENIEYTFPVPSYFINGSSAFMLRVEGDSMIDAGIFDRDYILVRRQQTAQNGDIVVALIDDEATVKRFFKEPNRIRLQPENERYSPIYATNNCTIVGKVIGIFRKL